MMDYLHLSITEIHEALVRHEVTPLDLAKEAIRKAKSSKDNAFEFIDEEGAISFASTLTEPEEGNMLWGIPYAAKDNFSVKGIPATASSNILNGYVPVFDATVIRKLKERKAVLIGKTTLDELAMGGTGTTGHLGKTFNPYDPSHQRMVGGSSCGSAAVVAAGIVPFALGSDTGDSVRKPASFAGLVGMKGTWGRVSRYGLFPFAPSLDHVAFFTRNAKDSAIVLEAISGRDDNDATSSFKDCENYADFSETSAKGKKIAVIKEIVDSIMDPFLTISFDKCLSSLKEKGYEIKYVDFGRDLLEAIYPTYFVISCAEATSNNANLDGIKFGPYQEGKTYIEVMSNARTKGFSELIKRRFVIGSFALMKDNQKELFLRAQKVRAQIVGRINEILSESDFILVPAAPSIAPRFDDSTDRLNSEYMIVDNHLALGNFSGLPSITLPLCFKDGMPIGVNFMGRAFEEKDLFEMASSFEAISGLDNCSIVNKKEGNL